MSTNPKMSEYQNYIFTSRYARDRDDLGRRETWDEAIDRVHEFWEEHLDKNGVEGAAVRTKLKEAMDAVRNHEIMGSMRVLMSAGKALHEHHVAGYNCAYTPIDSPRRFSEILYILMCGTGMGFSVERDEVEKLPAIPDKFSGRVTIVVPDNKVGWATSYLALIDALYSGVTPVWDLTQIRPYGSRLKTMGGRASGPEPLSSLFQYTVEVFKAAAGRRLTSIEVHDLVCKIADIVVVGGVRRSALISLSNLTDDRMRHAKSGEWWRPETEGGTPFRALANNSVAYTTKPDVDSYLREMNSLYESRAGERGIFSREAAKNSCPSRRDPNHNFGTNPCSEIILRPQEFCNLTEVVVRAGDTDSDLIRKVRLATFLGTLQSTLTKFNKVLGPEWRANCEEERLLGVSLTGIMDHKVLGRHHRSIVRDDNLMELLTTLRKVSVSENRKWAKTLDIPQSVATTCVKPSGTVSQLCNTGSGIHPRYSEYYIRRVVADNKDPLCEFMKNAGFPQEPSATNPYATVFSFPVASPKGAVTRHDQTAIDQLELWRMYNEAYCEHKPSITVYYKDNEFPNVMSYVWENFDEMSGVSFLPSGDDHVYTQAPYEEITEAKYKQLLKAMPKGTDWSALAEFENEDTTSVQPELACHGGACEL